MVGDVLDRLRELPDKHFHCSVSSPPYWALRDYGVAGQIGLEESPAEYLAKMVQVYMEVHRVLRDDGTCWINMGDSYAGSWGSQGREYSGVGVSALSARQVAASQRKKSGTGSVKQLGGLKPKDLVMMPHRLAIALQDAGWWVRQDIVWSKPNPMPESVRDRCTKSHEYIFLLTKSERYYYNAEAIKEECVKGDAGSEYHTGKTGHHQLGRASTKPRGVGFGHGSDSDERERGRVAKVKVPGGWDRGEGAHGSIHREGRTEAEYQEYMPSGKRNKRSVWTMATNSFPEAHFATFPPELPETCIKAGCPPGGVVLDPFLGAGTTALVADRLQCDCIGIELNPAYAEMSFNRIKKESTLLCDIKIIGIEETAACPL